MSIEPLPLEVRFILTGEPFCEKLTVYDWSAASPVRVIEPLEAAQVEGLIKLLPPIEGIGCTVTVTGALGPSHWVVLFIWLTHQVVVPARAVEGVGAGMGLPPLLPEYQLMVWPASGVADSWLAASPTQYCMVGLVRGAAGKGSTLSEKFLAPPVQLPITGVTVNTANPDEAGVKELILPVPDSGRPITKLSWAHFTVAPAAGKVVNV